MVPKSLEAARDSFFEVRSDQCSAKLAKGGSGHELPPHILVMDTGQPWVPEESKRMPKTQEELDDLYRETIKRGIIDHHGIDAVVLSLPVGVERKCATKMVADFPADVLSIIKKRDVSSVTAHFDSDLDSIASTYLAQSLVQSGDARRMPKITKALAEFVNLVDYGKYRETDPRIYSQSLQGVFGSIKSVLMSKQRDEMAAVWKDGEKTLDEKRRLAGEITARYNQELVDRSIELLNACERESSEAVVDMTNIRSEQLSLSEKTKALVEKGMALAIEEFEKFNREFEKSEKLQARVMTKDGRSIEVPMLIFDAPDMNPLAVTNMAYGRMPPETIVAVYAGSSRKYGGDMYDIGIKPETTDLFQLRQLEGSMNQAEKIARDEVFSNLAALVSGEASLTPEQQALLTAWKTTPQDLDKKWKALRPGFEHVGHGDPTVVVAGGSLLAASTTSMISFEQFRNVLKKQLEAKQDVGSSGESAEESLPKTEADWDKRALKERQTRGERVERLRLRVDQLFPGPELVPLRAKIYESLRVPQWGPHHNEGLFMDTHLDLIFDNLERARTGTFAPGVTDAVKALLQETARSRAADLEKYVFLHDISKMDTLLVKRKGADGKTVQQKMSWEEWQLAVPSEAQEDPVAMRRYLQEAGIEGISYYHPSTRGQEGKMHGDAGAEEVRRMGLEIDPAVLTAIENHEVAYQFTKPKAETYGKYFGSMSPEERAMALTASYIDTAASLGQTGEPDLSNFQALVESRRNHELLQAVEGSLVSLANLDQKKVAKLFADLKKFDGSIPEKSVGDLLDRFQRECKKATYDLAVLEAELQGIKDLTDEERQSIVNLVKNDQIEQIGKKFGAKMRFLKPALEKSVT